MNKYAHSHYLRANTKSCYFLLQIFDVSIPYLLSGTDATSALSMGTMATLIGKLLSGPICGFLGTKRVGWMSLVALAAISLSVALVDDSVIVRAFLLAVAASRFVMCFTWPATNQMLRAWFPADEHGQAWGIMATSSETIPVFFSLAD